MRQSKKIRSVDTLESVTTITSLELVKAKNAIDQFLYSCSHTLRAPLKSIAGLVNLLKNAKDNPDISPELFLNSIEQTVNKMETVLNELEKFLSNSRQHIETEAIDLHALVEKALLETGYESDASTKVEVKINQTAPFYNDNNRVATILSQLISNAFQFRDPLKHKHAILIEVHLDETACTLEVSDNGIGIKAPVLPYIFQLFYRGTELSKGSGVGLYIVREVVNKLSGTITVTSTDTVGSSFKVILPNLK